MRALTYDEWRDLGYQVRKGEKSSGRNAQRQPTFTRHQVEEREDFDRQNDLRFERN